MNIDKEQEKLQRTLSKAERALVKKAAGYNYDEITLSAKENGNIIYKGTDMEINRVVKKHNPPDTRALIFFLKNRNPERWSDTDSDSENSYGNLTDEQLVSLLKEEIKNYEQE